MQRVLPLLLLLLAAWSPPAAARSLVVRDLDVDVTVLPSGAIDVTETIRVRFDGSWNGILRDVSLRHRTAEGRSERLRLEVLSVTDADGTPLEFWREGDRWTRRVRVRVPGAEDATRTVVIRYRVENALRFFRGDGEAETFDELYWNVTGNEWEVPIESARVRVRLPEGVEATRVATYTGPEGSTASDAEVDTAGSVVTARTTRTLSPGEGLTIGVGWEAGHVAEPSAARSALQRVPSFLPLLVPVLAFLLARGRWRRQGRDPDPRAVAVRYEPPEEMTPAEMGTLVDHRVQLHDVTSILVDLAVRGHLHVEEAEEKRFLGLATSTEYVFHLPPGAEDRPELAAHERCFLRGLAERGSPEPAPEWIAAPAAVPGGGGGDAASGGGADGGWTRVRFKDLKDSFYEELPGIHTAIYQRLIERGYYRRRPDHVVAIWVGAAIAIFVVGAIATATVAESGWGGLEPIPLGIAVVLTAAVVLGFGVVMPARTEAGARAREAALGFREFLDKVEEPRFRRMITSPDLFERYLPHAMAFRVEGRWARAFEGMLSEPPRWYHGSTDGRGGGFHTADFASSLRGITSEAGSAMSSSPSSSGSGGGGSSGGGSGGGGGGGW